MPTPPSRHSNRPRARRKLLWRLYPSYLLILLPALATVAVYASSTLRDGFQRETARDLRVRAQLFATLLGRFGRLPPPATVQRLCSTLGAQTDTRYTVVLPSGRVLADSHRDPARMDNHGSRPEIRRALSSSSGQAVRRSATLGQDMMYVAVPLRSGKRVVAIVRASTPLRAIQATLRRTYWRLGLGGLLVAILAGALSLLVAHRINRPLRQMQASAARFAAGDLRHRLVVPDTEEAAELAMAMNHMAAELDLRIRSVTEQRNELEAVLASMTEAVLVVDSSGKLLRFNHAARDLLGLEDRDKKRPMEKLLKSSELQRLLSDVLSGKGAQEAEVPLRQDRDQEKHLGAVGATLHGPDREPVGALVVLHDLTHLRRLESVRTDFVANVSHELKTPVTAIRGFVETLREGALHEPDTAQRFLEIVAKHADRLEAIIEDLLALSRLEQEALVDLERKQVGPLLVAARQLCEHAALERGVAVVLEGDMELEIPMNAPLLERAMVNLCDNAIKYSETGARVVISVAREGDHALISIQDNGCGIPPADRDRVFERFYRVDRARSRERGGTGLGLSLVKHIVNLHHGRVWLESVVGQGTTFFVQLPRAARLHSAVD